LIKNQSGTDLPVKLFCWICTICYASTSASYDCLCFVCSSSHQIDQSWMANSYNSTNQNKNNHNLNSLANVNATNSRFEKDSLKSRFFFFFSFFLSINLFFFFKKKIENIMKVIIFSGIFLNCEKF